MLYMKNKAKGLQNISMKYLGFQLIVALPGPSLVI